MKIKIGHKFDQWFIVTDKDKIIDVVYSKAKAEELLKYYLAVK